MMTAAGNFQIISECKFRKFQTFPRITFTVRKISSGVGVERVFPLHCPSIDKIEVQRKGRVRRAKLYYLRKLSGKAARIKERRDFA